MCALSLAWRNSARKLYLQWQSSAHTHTHTHTHACSQSVPAHTLSCLSTGSRPVPGLKTSEDVLKEWVDEVTTRPYALSVVPPLPTAPPRLKTTQWRQKKKDVRNPAANSEGESFPVIHQLLSVSSSHSHKHSTAHFCNGSSHGNWTHEAVLPLSKWWPTVTAAYYSAGTQVIVRKT